MAAHMSQEEYGELAWHVQARCRGLDPSVFYPDRGATGTFARSLCTVCGVREECLEYALSHDERFGIWGGMSERERRLLRARRLAAKVSIRLPS
jgi:WhiB family redox-sensing transcriptional regulator